MKKFGDLVGSIDEGTSSARFMVFKAGTAEIVCSHQVKLPQIYPHEGWVEQDPMIILSVVTECVETALKKLVALGGSPKDIIAVGITNQRETTVAWDRTTGEPLHNAILWLDMRTSSTVDQLLNKIPNRSRNKNYLKPLCGLPLSPYFSALKMRWLKDNVQRVQQALKDGTCIFGTIDSWLIWNLTGGVNGGLHITDVTNASRTMLMNIETLQWDAHLMNFFEISREVLPEIKSSSEVYGDIKITGLQGVPIAGCLGDQQAALVGQQCFQNGEAKATFGTGCFLLFNTGSKMVKSSHGLLTTVAYQMGRKSNPVYALEGSVAIAGAAIGWLKDNMSIIENSEDVEAVARSVENTADVYFVPAFSGLYAPYWNQEARGIICGLTDEVKRAHIVRATLEAVSYQVRDILDAMVKDTDGKLNMLKVDGGMTSNSLLLQLMADLVGIDVLRPKVLETTSLGAAMIAYRAVSGESAEVVGTSLATVYKPQITENERDIRYSKWKMAVERSFGWDTSKSESRKLFVP